jgi:hypothetical protein
LDGAAWPVRQPTRCPHPVDDVVNGYWAIGLDQQYGQQASQLRVTDRDRSTINVCLDSTEQTELRRHGDSLR